MTSIFKPFNVDIKYNQRIIMRDNISLSADIYFPKDRNKPLPVILTRTPYDNSSDDIVESAIYFAQKGYIFVAQDTRGRNDSEGEFRPWIDEFNDGFDTLEWIGIQPWCDSNIGMVGGSYVGNVQWQAASMGSEYLKTIIPRVIGDNLHESPHYQGGAFQLGWSATWSWRQDGRTTQSLKLYDWNQLFMTLPLKKLDEFAGKNVDFFREWISHPDYDYYWKELAIKERYQDIKIPVLQIGGWYDFFTAGTFNNYIGMKELGGSDLARSNQKVILGPWVHNAGSLSYAGDMDYGLDSKLDILPIELEWFNYWLKGINNGVKEQPDIKIFTMGINKWVEENQWPLENTVYTKYYFHSNGSSNSLFGDGFLSIEPPALEPEDSYIYNPAFPVPTLGGNTCCNPNIISWGAYDQSSIEARNDVLVYTSELLESDLEVTGNIVVKLYASSDCIDTDFTAKLVDVYPNGSAINLCDGIIRARYRESTVHQKTIEPYKIYEYEINLWPTSNIFKKGHKIRVDISSSNFPRFDRNLNTGGEFALEDEFKLASQKIYHNSDYKSHIILPIIIR